MKENVKMDDVMRFAAQNGVKVMLKGAVSLATVVGLTAFYYAFAPRNESYKAEVQIMLESREGRPVYPNGDSFGMRDIVSAPVMNRVWTKYGFDKMDVKFEDFCGWFSIVAYDKERAKIDAEFQGKMSKRNITVTELTALQKEYEAKLSTLASNCFALMVRPDALLDRDTAAKLLADVPEIWFREYATIKAPQIPAVVTVDAIRSYIERSKASGGRTLELIDAIRKYISELKATCVFVRTGIMRGRNAKIEGVDLGTYESQLEMLTAEILRLKNRLLVNGSEIDLGGYLAARQDDMDCEKLDLEERIKAVQQTLDLFGEAKRGATEAKRGTAPDGAAAQLTLQADNGFFADFAAMIRRDANQELVKRYAHELTELRKQQADFASRKLYYDQIERYMKANLAKTKAASGKISAEMIASIDSFMQQLMEIGRKIVAFRDECLMLYRTSDQFYVIAEPVAYAKSFKFTVPRFALGLLALWALYNLVGLVKLWNRE